MRQKMAYRTHLRLNDFFLLQSCLDWYLPDNMSFCIKKRLLKIFSFAQDTTKNKWRVVMSIFFTNKKIKEEPIKNQEIDSSTLWKREEKNNEDKTCLFSCHHIFSNNNDFTTFFVSLKKWECVYNLLHIFSFIIISQVGKCSVLPLHTHATRSLPSF